MIASYPCPIADAAGCTEAALLLDGVRAHRLLIIAPLFEEMNRTRRWLADVMRQLDAAGIDSFLPDLPGCNESLAALDAQSIASWRAAVDAATAHFMPTAVFALRGGNLLVDERLAVPLVRLAPLDGAKILRGLVRARVMASKEAGDAENADQLMQQGRADGLELAGYRLSPTMVSDLEQAVVANTSDMVLDAAKLGGPPLWLRVEPSHDPEQAAALAALLAAVIR